MRIPTCLALAVAAALADPSARADQDVFFPGKTRVLVSAEDLNVLTVERGRIDGAVANEDELNLVRRDGRLYFRLVSAERAVPLFVEVGRDGAEPELYTLLLQPVAGLSAERVVIRDRGRPARADNGGGGDNAGATPAPLPGRAVGPRLRDIKRLALAMARDWELDGYDTDRSAQPVRSSPTDGVRVERTAAYRGTELDGEVWTVRNIGDTPLALAEEDHLGPATVAVAIEGAPVAPGETARVLVIRHAGRGGDE